jgi:hypothetical protein
VKQNYSAIENAALVSNAIHHLKTARDLLRAARADKSAAKVRDALKSAEGAQRHADRVSSSAGGPNAVTRGKHFGRAKDFRHGDGPDT